MKKIFNILLLFSICYIGLSQSPMIFSYDMSLGDTVLFPYSTHKHINNQYVLDVEFPESDSVFEITVVRTTFWNDTIVYNHEPKAYPRRIYPNSYVTKAESIIYNDNYVTYRPAIFINTTDGDNSVIYFNWRIR